MATTVLSRPATQARSTSRSRVLDLRVAGTLVMLAGAGIFMAIITAEALYPAAYSTASNAISDLGGTEPPNSVILQPSATIFDVAMMVAGLAVVVASRFVHRAFERRSVTVPLLVLGLCAFGVGLFPGNTGTPHALFAMGCFVAGGVAAVTASLVTGSAFRWLSIALGAIALVTLGSYLVLGDSNPMMAMGIGGVERWIVDPILIWLIAFGAYLLAIADAGADAGEGSAPTGVGA